MSLIIADFQILFYQTKYAELEVEIDTLEKELANKDAAEMARQMADTSMKYLKNQSYFIPMAIIMTSPSLRSLI